ncbi:UNVERIFIED_ORG: hypothetical protein FNL38_105383 [Nocardia globerula]|uniref:Uncharacterized protein n=1 Tax=Nocardia globerula TaxID=1818 RepID=A0A652YNC2_NOCGL|nr:hypothetical protein C8E04_2775 [Rhodococcus globerulus]
MYAGSSVVNCCPQYSRSGIPRYSCGAPWSSVVQTFDPRNVHARRTDRPPSPLLPGFTWAKTVTGTFLSQMPHKSPFRHQ